MSIAADGFKTITFTFTEEELETLITALESAMRDFDPVFCYRTHDRMKELVQKIKKERGYVNEWNR